MPDTLILESPIKHHIAKMCSYKDCVKKHFALGYCRTHYNYFITLKHIDDDKNPLLLPIMEKEETPFEEVNFLLKNTVNNMLNSLNEREKKVINLRFGLTGGNPMTPEKIGKIFCVQKERVRQIEAEALRKLRHSTRCKIAENLLEELCLI